MGPMNGLDFWKWRKCCFFFAGILKFDRLSCNCTVPSLFDGTEKIRKTLDLDFSYNKTNEMY